MDTSRVLPQVPLKVKEDLTMEVKPIRILDENEKKKSEIKKILMVKVPWRSSQVEEETWERKSEMKKKYP